MSNRSEKQDCASSRLEVHLVRSRQIHHNLDSDKPPSLQSTVSVLSWHMPRPEGSENIIKPSLNIMPTICESPAISVHPLWTVSTGPTDLGSKLFCQQNNSRKHRSTRHGDDKTEIHEHRQWYPTFQSWKSHSWPILLRWNIETFQMLPLFSRTSLDSTSRPRSIGFSQSSSNPRDLRPQLSPRLPCLLNSLDKLDSTLLACKTSSCWSPSSQTRNQPFNHVVAFHVNVMTERVELRNMTAIAPTSRAVEWKHPVSADGNFGCFKILVWKLCAFSTRSGSITSLTFHEFPLQRCIVVLG